MPCSFDKSGLRIGTKDPQVISPGRRSHRPSSPDDPLAGTARTTQGRSVPHPVPSCPHCRDHRYQLQDPRAGMGDAHRSGCVIQVSEFRRLYFAQESPLRRADEWTILAESCWPHDGRKLTPQRPFESRLTFSPPRPRSVRRSGRGLDDVYLHRRTHPPLGATTRPWSLRLSGASRTSSPSKLNQESPDMRPVFGGQFSPASSTLT